MQINGWESPIEYGHWPQRDAIIIVKLNLELEFWFIVIEHIKIRKLANKAPIKLWKVWATLEELWIDGP